MVDSTPLEKRLAANRRKREEVETALTSLRDELATLLAHGQDENVPVAAMAKAAGISRQAAHKHLRRKDKR